jgi:hypothetical protein
MSFVTSPSAHVVQSRFCSPSQPHASEMDAHRAIQRRLKSGGPLFGSAESESNFIYKPLNPHLQETRLLEISPDQGGISCSIVSTSIPSDVVLPYSALSYTWGNPTPVEPIRVNGQSLWVAAGLYQALLYLKMESVSVGRFKIWIDALCS